MNIRERFRSRGEWQRGASCSRTSFRQSPVTVPGSRSRILQTLPSVALLADRLLETRRPRVWLSSNSSEEDFSSGSDSSGIHKMIRWCRAPPLVNPNPFCALNCLQRDTFLLRSIGEEKARVLKCQGATVTLNEPMQLKPQQLLVLRYDKIYEAAPVIGRGFLFSYRFQERLADVWVDLKDQSILCSEHNIGIFCREFGFRFSALNAVPIEILSIAVMVGQYRLAAATIEESRKFPPLSRKSSTKSCFTISPPLGPCQQSELIDQALALAATATRLCRTPQESSPVHGGLSTIQARSTMIVDSAMMDTVQGEDEFRDSIMSIEAGEVIISGREGSELFSFERELPRITPSPVVSVRKPEEVELLEEDPITLNLVALRPKSSPKTSGSTVDSDREAKSKAKKLIAESCPARLSKQKKPGSSEGGGTSLTKKSPLLTRKATIKDEGSSDSPSKESRRRRQSEDRQKSSTKQHRRRDKGTTETSN